MIYIKNLPVISETLAGMFPCELYYDGNNDSKVSLYEEGKNNVKKISGNFLYSPSDKKIFKGKDEISIEEITKMEKEGN